MLDTSVLVAAIRGPRGASSLLVRAALLGKFVALFSAPLVLEYESVMTRPDHQAVSGLTPDEVNELLDALTLKAEQVMFFYTWRPALNDPKDEMVLETAINGQADAIVTFNVRDFRRVRERFGVEVILPREALRRIANEAK